MSRDSRWILPDGVDEIIPPQAASLEQLRRRLLDVVTTWGYALCTPAIVEFLDSLVSGTGDDLELQTFKLTDQVSGRLLGIPADITPQIARIDAHRINADTPTRLCYIGPILHTQPDKFAGSRNPLQLGAELYGHPGIESDAEVIALMVEVLAVAGVADITLDLGHMKIFHGLAEAAKLDADAGMRLLDVLLRKSVCELPALLADVTGPAATWLSALPSLNGDGGVVARARAALDGAPRVVQSALDDLDALVRLLAQRCPQLDVHIDLADLRGYRYHTGVMFAAYTLRMGRAIAWGGRYDNIGERYGRARAATGFSTDLKLLASLAPAVEALGHGILAPSGTDAALLAAISALRSRGDQVIQVLPGQAGGPGEMGCKHELRQIAGQWQVLALQGS